MAISGSIVLDRSITQRNQKVRAVLTDVKFWRKSGHSFKRCAICLKCNISRHKPIIKPIYGTSCGKCCKTCTADQIPW